MYHSFAWYMDSTLTKPFLKHVLSHGGGSHEGSVSQILPQSCLSGKQNTKGLGFCLCFYEGHQTHPKHPQWWTDNILRSSVVGTWGVLRFSDTFLCFCLLAFPVSLLQDHLVLQGSARGSFFFFPFSRFPWCTHMDSISTHHRWAPDSYH